VLSFNTWLLDVPSGPFGMRSAVSEQMQERLARLPQYLAKTEADVILLQEVWSNDSKRRIIREMKRYGYGHAAFTKITHWFLFCEVEMGDGLLILSKFPIRDDIQTHSFSVATQRIEKFTKKGIIHAVIQHPDWGPIDVYNSHTGAVNFENGNYNPEQVYLRSRQINELAEWIRKTRTSSITILGADLNLHYQKFENGSFRPEYQAEYLKFVQLACGYEQTLQNTFLLANHQTVDDPASATFSRNNPYVRRGYFGKLPDETEDYVFVCENPELKLVSSKIVFRNQISGNGPERLSDHFGVLSEIETAPPEKKSERFFLSKRF
jgi:endonuclease/exonuclease/phosphatase family metal-dependent hydrolase